jgi:F-type H+-transporting ATPase subunit epsilon
MPLHVEVIAVDRVIMTEDTDVVVAQTASGQVAILPAHAPMVTLLVPGQLRLGRGSTEHILSVSGGYLEVRENQVVVLADAAERAEDIDLQRAIAARERAVAELAQKQSNVEAARASIALSRAIARIRVAEITRGRTAMRRPI